MLTKRATTAVAFAAVAVLLLPLCALGAGDVDDSTTVASPSSSASCITFETVNVDDIILPDGTSLAVDVEEEEEQANDDDDHNDRLLLGNEVAEEETEFLMELYYDHVAAAAADGALTNTSHTINDVDKHFFVRHRQLEEDKEWIVLVTEFIKKLPKIVKAFRRWFGNPPRKDQVCASHQDDRLATLIEDASYCRDGGYPQRKIPTCIADKTCTSLQQNGNLHITVGHDYKGGKKSTDEPYRKARAEALTTEMIADKIHAAYDGVGKVYMYFWETYNAKTNTVRTSTKQYGGGGTAYVYFYCGTTDYQKRNYKKGWFRDRVRECATRIQPFAYSVYPAINKDNNDHGEVIVRDISDF